MGCLPFRKYEEYPYEWYIKPELHDETTDLYAATKGNLDSYIS
jgi:hypothetical protein